MDDVKREYALYYKATENMKDTYRTSSILLKGQD